MVQTTELPDGWIEVEISWPPKKCTGCGSPGHHRGWRRKEKGRESGAFFGDCCGGWAAEGSKPRVKRAVAKEVLKIADGEGPGLDSGERAVRRGQRVGRKR